ncbi:zinc finger protein 84-like isoform X3 [Salvelinus namaycush]|nr:zinc finger protein 84-like isoform X3 [Salvelinus namaycush]
MGVETWPAPPVIKQEEMDDDDMESQAYDKWIPVTHWADQNITGESDEQERSPASGGSRELGLDDFKTEQSPLLVSAEDAPAPTKKKYDKRYSCEICGKTENKKARMTSHMRKHTGLPFNCDICGEKFQCQKLLTRHKRFNHYTGIIYSCSVCGKTFMQVTSRDTHERGHTGKNYWCSDCGETFKERQDRDTHECIVYKGERPFSCSECNEDFQRQYHLKKHQLEKHPLMVDQTVEPEPESKDIEDQHIQLSESSEAPTRFTCDICGMTIMNKGNINRHMLTHTKKPFSCDICGENFKRKAQFTRHQSKHARVEEKVEKPYSCTVCGMTFVYSKMRNNHERKHIGEDYCCSDCGKTFKERQERDTHECIVFKGDRPFRCSECNEDFERQDHLKQHQLEKHPLMVDQPVEPEPESKDIENQQSQLSESSETEAPTRFTCDTCGMIIMNKGNINRHMLIHKKKPFSCDICGENFKRHTCLAKHQGKHESVEEKVEKPYSCSMCGMMFVYPKMRDNHESKHIGEDFWCSGCDKTFKERGDRDVHKCVVYKGDRPFRCSECNEDFERQYHLKRHQLEKHPLMMNKPRPGHDTAMVVQGAQPSNDNDPKADMSTLGGKVPVT